MRRWRCRLRRISVRPQRDGEIGLEILDRNRLVILDLQPLRSPRWNGSNARAEYGTALGFLGAAFAHLEEAGINRLLLELVVDFFGALPFEDHSRQAHRAVPRGEIGNRGMAGKRENVVPFLDGAGVVGKHLAHEDARIAIVDADGDFHFLERENRRIRLLLVARDKDSRIRQEAAPKSTAQ